MLDLRRVLPSSPSSAGVSTDRPGGVFQKSVDPDVGIPFAYMCLEIGFFDFCSPNQLKMLASMSASLLAQHSRLRQRE